VLPRRPRRKGRENAPDVMLRTYARIFEELDRAERLSAVEAVRAGRAGVRCTR
jgi:hypothetical protein